MNRAEIAVPAGESKIAYLVNHYPAASHTFIRREILALERRGFAVSRIALRGWSDKLADPEDERERERTWFVLQRGVPFLLREMAVEACLRPLRFLRALRLSVQCARGSEKSLLHHLVYLAEACAVARRLAHAGIGHLHAHFGTNSAEVALLACTLGATTYSLTIHGPEEFDHPQALALGRKLRGAAFVAAISSFTRSQLFRWVERSHWDRIHVVHCGVDQAFQRLAAGSPPGGRRLVCVARLHEQKGHLLLLAAMRQVFDRGCVFDLVLAGDGELRGEIEERVRTLGLDAHVRITGWIAGAKVRDEILGARALVLPSFAEGLPVVIMEAMALRRPVITTYVAGIPELVRAGEHGWLIPAGDVDALADAIVECLDADDEALAAMGERARRRVLERHDVDVEAGKLAQLLHQQLRDAAIGAGHAR